MTDEEAITCQSGLLGSIYSHQRLLLSGQSAVLEKKHAIACPLGWRTRGQATLVPGPVVPEEKKFHIVLAKGGVFIPSEFEERQEQNDEILRMFFERQPDSVIRVEGKTGIREMVDYDADFVEKSFDKRLNMEYDWKRCASGIVLSSRYEHIAFNTKPWETIEQFHQIRGYWLDYTKNSPEMPEVPR